MNSPLQAACTAIIYRVLSNGVELHIPSFDSREVNSLASTREQTLSISAWKWEWCRSSGGSSSKGT